MQIYRDKEIYYGLLILMISRIFLGNEEVFFVLSLIYFFACVSRTMKLRIPQMAGLKLYMTFIIYSTIIRFCLYSARNVVRDLFYIVPTVLWIIIGYNLCADNKTGKSLLKTLYLYGMVISIKCVIDFLLNPTLDFNQIRIVFGTYVYDIGFLLPIMAFEMVILKRIIFSTKVDRFILLLMIVQIGLSFGRIAILEPLIAFSIISILSIKSMENKGRTIKILAGIFLALTIAVVVIFYALPDSTTSVFLAKIENSATEINIKQNIDSIASAMQNWRAYEMQATLKQWGKSGILSQIFGHGMGKGIELEFVPYNWKSAGMVENGEMPLAHNGFYTLLPKGGLFAVISMLLIFAGAIHKGFQMTKCENRDRKVSGIILISIMVAGFANMWVVRGAVCSEAFLVWGSILGWIYAEERHRG